MPATPAGLICVVGRAAQEATPHDLATLARHSHTLIEYKVPAREEAPAGKGLHVPLDPTWQQDAKPELCQQGSLEHCIIAICWHHKCCCPCKGGLLQGSFCLSCRVQAPTP